MPFLLVVKTPSETLWYGPIRSEPVASLSFLLGALLFEPSPENDATGASPFTMGARVFVRANTNMHGSSSSARKNLTSFGICTQTRSHGLSWSNFVASSMCVEISISPRRRILSACSSRSRTSAW